MERTRRLDAVRVACGVPLAAAGLAFPLRHPAVVSVIPADGLRMRSAATSHCSIIRSRPPCGAIWPEKD